MTELLNCPFCGGGAESRLYDSEYFVQCMQCFNSTAADHQDEAEAVAAWNRRAQPAEADGVVELGSDAWMALHLLDRVVVGVEEEPRLEQVENIVRRMGAALSAVTAERDELRYRLEAASEWATMASEKLKERDQLRAEVEALRPDAERYRWLRDIAGNAILSDLMRDCTMDGWDAAVDAAMAAKEGAGEP